jgi:hypothetical protein
MAVSKRQHASTTGSLKAGVLTVRNRKRFEAELADMTDGDAIVTVEKVRAARSAAFNAYYWAVPNKMLAFHLGKTSYQTHELMLAMHFPRDVTAATGNGTLIGDGKYVVGAESHRLTNEEFGRFVTAVIGWAADELALYIPDPDPEWFRDKHQTERAA